MKKETWTIQSRDQNGRLLAETRIYWEPGKGAVKTETSLLVPGTEWEAFRESLRLRLSSE